MPCRFPQLSLNSISVLLYVDDLLIIIQDPPSVATTDVVSVHNAMDHFSEHTGLSVNLSKSAILLKGYWPPNSLAVVDSTKIPIKASYKHLGVGNRRPGQAYAPALHKALGWAFSMQHSKLSLPELMEIYPWSFTRQDFPPPSQPVVSALRTIYNVALPREKGGFPLAQPKTFLL